MNALLSSLTLDPLTSNLLDTAFDPAILSLVGTRLLLRMKEVGERDANANVGTNCFWSGTDATEMVFTSVLTMSCEEMDQRQIQNMSLGMSSEI